MTPLRLARAQPSVTEPAYIGVREIRHLLREPSCHRPAMGTYTARDMPQASLQLGAANPYALSSILQASQGCTIVASEDICDDRGTKLWARNQPVSHALQQRLLDRKLRQPLEACLKAPDGVNSADLVQATRELLEQASPVALALRPWASAIVAEVPRLPLHAVAQLLLTAMRSSRPEAFDHAIRTMALAGAMYLHAGCDHYELRLAMLAGLLHDIGELYVNPDLLDPGHALTPAGFRHVVIHPRVGETLLSQLTDYPATLSRAVGEHHERGTGMGYPSRARHLSWLGCRLSAMETLSGVLANEHGDAWEHGSLALRIIPGEFDPVAISFSSQAARRMRGQSPAAPQLDASGVWELSCSLASHIADRMAAAQQLADSTAPGRVQDNARLAATLLAQLTQAGHEIGMWAPRELLGQELTELHVANQEIQFRLRAIQRTTSWLDVGLQPHEEAQLALLWQSQEALVTATKEAQPEAPAVELSTATA